MCFRNTNNNNKLSFFFSFVFFTLIFVCRKWNLHSFNHVLADVVKQKKKKFTIWKRDAFTQYIFPSHSPWSISFFCRSECFICYFLRLYYFFFVRFACKQNVLDQMLIIEEKNMVKTKKPRDKTSKKTKNKNSSTISDFVLSYFDFDKDHILIWVINFMETKNYMKE